MVNPEKYRKVCHPEVFKRIPFESIKQIQIHYHRVYIQGKLLARGGSTTVLIVMNDDSEFFGSSKCMAIDIFKKEEGRRRAFKRAIRKYWDTLPPDVRRLKEGESL